MSPGEIRRLAEDCYRNAYLFGQTVQRRVELDKESALLAYANMIDRCEKLKFNMIPHKRDTEIVDYILRGEAGKEER